MGLKKLLEASYQPWMQTNEVLKILAWVLEKEMIYNANGSDGYRLVVFVFGTDGFDEGTQLLSCGVDSSVNSVIHQIDPREPNMCLVSKGTGLEMTGFECIEKLLILLADRTCHAS